MNRVPPRAHPSLSPVPLLATVHAPTFSRRQFCTYGLVLGAMGSMELARAAPAQTDRVGAEAAPLVAAASDLRHALAEVLAVLQPRLPSGAMPRVVYGASGDLTRQIEQGAPFELFLSADEAYVQRLQRGRWCVDAGHRYARGRLVLWAAPARVFQPDPALSDVRRALATGRVPRLAMAHPEHAPYGRAAQQALQHAGLWTALQPFLRIGQNAAQAAQFAALGADGALLPLSLVRARAWADQGGAWALVQAQAYAPLYQRMVRLRRAGRAAQTLYDALRSEATAPVWAQNGLSLDEEPAA